MQDTTTLTRNEAITLIKAGLKRRSNKQWSVKGGRGTAYGWITISAPPKRCGEFGYMTEADCAELAELLGLKYVHCQGASVPASNAHYREYIDRAETGRTEEHAERYWD